jgi:hypothetical protein
MFKCCLCSSDFTLKKNLNRHLDLKKCKTELMDYKLIQEKLEELQQLKQLKQLKIENITGPVIVGNNNVNNTTNNVNIKIELNINPIQKLNTNHIQVEEMKKFVEQYDLNPDKLNLLLGGYVKNIICDPEHPENQPVKYIKKRPPTYNSLIENCDGNKINVIKGLKDTCELLTDPILNTLKTKLQQFLKKYRKDINFNYLIYEETISELRNELNKANVKKALSSVLQNDILNNIEMKLSLETKTN